jgi:hypothetical protein
MRNNFPGNHTYLSKTNAQLVDPKFAKLENLLPPETKVLLEYFGSNLFEKEPFQTSIKLFYNNTCELKTFPRKNKRNAKRI